MVWIFLTKNWGFIPMNAALWVVYLRNYRLWSAREDRPWTKSLTSLSETSSSEPKR